MSRLEADKRLRIAESRENHARLRSQFDQWFQEVLASDFGSLIRTRLDALGQVLGNAVGKIELQFDGINGLADKGVVYEQCRRIDHKTIWTRRVWDYYRDKIEQRGHASFHETVAAADEVVWSCFLPAIRANPDNLHAARAAVPLPYLEAFYTPRAFMTSVPPDELKFADDREFFRQCLAAMPIPLVGMPTECLRSPSFLVTLSHEVGHHVQHLLLPNKGLVNEFAALVRATVQAVAEEKHLAPGSAPDRWMEWGEELFADLYAITQLGEAAAWAIHEYLWTDDQGMWIAPAEKEYPCPGVRQAILRHACDRLRIEPDKTYGDWRATTSVAPGDMADVRLDLQLAQEVVSRVMTAKPAGCASLQSIAAGSLPSLDEVTRLSAHLTDRHGANPDRGEMQTRAVLSAGVRALAGLLDVDTDEDRDAQSRYLTANLASALVKTRHSVLRADEPAADTEGATMAFWNLLKSS